MNTPTPARPDPLLRLRDDVRAMQAYVVQSAHDMVKLDAMENPYTLPRDLQDQLAQRLSRLALNRYPGERVNTLRTALARYSGMPEGLDIMLGNGSDELISLLALACARPGASVLAPVPGFVMYAMSAQLQGLAFHGVPLTADFELDEATMSGAIAQHQPAIVYIAYPNNPTANLWDDGTIRRLIAQVSAYGGLVVMDEAYQPFSSKSWLDEIRQHPAANAHVLLMRTLSKFGLAGVRLGYMVGPAALVREIDKVRPPYNISVLNAECALFALEHAAVFDAQAQAITAERSRLQQSLAALGVASYASQANMVLIRVKDAADCFAKLKQQGVLVKNVSTMHPLLAQCLRLTVGTPEENQRLLLALKDAL